MSSVAVVPASQGEPDFERAAILRPEAAAEALSRCDWAIVRTLERIGLATSFQLERLHFHALPAVQRSARGRRTLQRLVDLSVLATSDPPPNDQSGESPAPMYTLGTAGALPVRMCTNAQVRDDEAGGTEPTDEQRTARTLAITQLFVDLVEHDRTGDLDLEAFRTGTASHWPDGLGCALEPDAFIRVTREAATDFWWVEVDQELESTALILAKVQAYLDFLRRTEPGPDGVVPRIMLGALTNLRAEALRSMIGELSAAARQMFVVTHMPNAVSIITKELRG